MPASQFLSKKHISRGYYFKGKAQREERWEYPLEAIREIIINMIVHRDYMAPGDSIIKIFDESIEFFNPGRLAGGLTAEQLTSGNYISAVRNKQIALIFKEAGLIEKYGSGIKRARLHVCSASPETPFLRVGVSSVAGDWQEGSSFWYFYQAGSACFSRAAYKHRDWAFEVAQPG